MEKMEGVKMYYFVGLLAFYCSLNGAYKLGIVHWRQVVQDRNGWRRVTR